ncbi:hypothetical protein KUL152_14990 [Tenacibaculum sp. KUL152]|nr:hypothetical protein KUL152_14990 [Tenacibaculum sp. KUL152]
MTSEQKAKFYRYWKVAFKYLFSVFFAIVTIRVIVILLADRDESMTIGSITLGYVIITFGSLGLSMLLAFIAVKKED